MKVTGHLTEAVYKRYAIVNESDTAEGLDKVAQFTERPSPSSSVTALRRAK